MQSFRVEQTQQIPTPEKPEDAGTEYDRLKITAPSITRKCILLYHRAKGETKVHKMASLKKKGRALKCLFQPKVAFLQYC